MGAQDRGIDRHLTAEIELPRQFVLPAKHRPAPRWMSPGQSYAGRSARRCTCYRDGTITNEHIVGYLNRLSSLLFILARHVESDLGQKAEQAKTSSK